MSYDLIFQQALKLHNQEKFDEAEALYRQILETAPNNQIILNLLGLIAQSKGMYAASAEWFVRAIAQNPQSAEYYFNYAWSLERSDKPVEAIEAYHRALQLQPGIKEAHNALGKLYLHNGKTEAARQEFQTAIDFEPGYAEARANLAHMENNLSLLQKLEEKYKDEALIPYYICLMQQENGESEAALASALRADKLIEDENTKLLIGEFYLQKQDKNKATDYFYQALQLNPKSVNALINLANLNSDANAAEQMYKKALDISPQNADAHLNYADLLYRQHRLHEALEEYRQTIILNPKQPEVFNNLGIIQRDFGDYEEALGLFFSAFFKQPEREEYALNIAETLILFYEKEPKTARKIAQSWQNNAPDNVFACRINEVLNHNDSGKGTEYTRKLFEQFADNFDGVMGQIDYKLPQLIAEAIGSPNGTIIELGCGTGLTGKYLKTKQNHLIGIDISPAMLEKAKTKNIYDELVEADIATYCCKLPTADWVVAADVFGYIGKLDAIISQVFPHNFCFSTTNTTVANFELCPNGRYHHNPEYIKKLLQNAGYNNIMSENAVLRQENNTDVIGTIWIAKEN